MARRSALFGLVLCATLALTGLTSASSAYPSTRQPGRALAAPHQGGSLTVLENAGFLGGWTGFDPAVTTSQSEFEPYVLGVLFDDGPHYTLVPDLATGYSVSDGGLTLTVTLRHGVTFSNGDPFDSTVVAFNWKRDIETSLPNGAQNAIDWPMSSVDTPNSSTVVAHFSKVFAPIASELAPPSTLGLTVDPVALQKIGEAAYNIAPIGAGPFEVVTDKPGADLVVKRNPAFWKRGYPKLNTLRSAGPVTPSP